MAMFKLLGRGFPRAALAMVLLGGLAVGSGCARKSGCPVNEPAEVKTDKKGNFKGAKGSSNLFPKHMRAKKRRG